MAHYDLEEQEQLAQIKHFWNRYGNLIASVLIVVFGGIAAFNGWNYWQRNQASQAAVLFDEVEKAAAAKDAEKLERTLSDIRTQFGKTTPAAQAALIAASSYVELGQLDKAKAALQWVAESSQDAAYQGVARLRLAGLAMDAQQWDEAGRWLTFDFPEAFKPMAADRQGDVWKLQGQADKAVAEYRKAWEGMDKTNEYRQLIAVKLAALGVVVETPSEGAAR
jgi:predicted negative regulator of RcsB-dependent stress response